MDARLASLRSQMEELARHDRRHVVFGATGHGWVSAPVEEEALAAVEREHGVALPASYRTWLATVGAGAGPFYGLLAPSEAQVAGGVFAGPLPAGSEPSAQVPGTLVLTEQGCGYRDRLVLAGPHQGEVFLDLREALEPLSPWYASFEGWLGAWLRHARAEWACRTLADGDVDADEAFLDRCREDLVRVVAGTDDPMESTWPLALAECWRALAALHLRDGAFEDAERAFEEGARTSNEPDAWRAIGRCRVAGARGDDEARLRAADEGLASESLWFSSRTALLRERRFALEGLERWDEALEAVEAIARHLPNDLFATYDVAWIRCARGEPRVAARWLVEAAGRGVACDAEASMAERVVQVSAELLRALRASGEEERAVALESVLGGVA